MTLLMRRPRPVSLQRQQGLALIMVLLVFAVVSVLATAIIDRQATDIQRSGNMFTLQQTRAFTYGAEQAVRTGLYLDWKADKEKDHGNEEWAKPRSFPLEPGKIYVSIRDAQGRFNLNSMAAEAANKTLQTKRFANLLNILGLDVQLASRVSRWMDKNSQADDVYQAQEPPYRAAYQGCKHVSELLLIEELDQQTYQALLPYVSCLPFDVQLNVNTASAAVLASLASGLTLQDGASLVSARTDKGYSSVDEFWNQSILERYTQPQPAGDKQPPATEKWDKGAFSINSEYFEMFARVDLNDRYATSEALIRRDKNDARMTVLYRDYSRREEKPVAPQAGDSGQNSASIPPAAGQP
ncbi:type II secretion system minor pseudopilin GspK [Bacterioplanoides pacificum]|uniref:Type II secretion system protein K n=1 Tax=Bacterioplanoides pacificum TaxID=1171596 RepID=A0ABV7VTH1_9GAMM